MQSNFGKKEQREMAAEKIQEKNVAATAKKKLQKSYFDVLGLCCSSEVPLIENILRPLDGVKDVSVIVPSRTVIVVHDHLLISQLQIVKALNQARLEANVRLYGETSYTKKWPSPYAIICGILLLLSLFKYIYHPFEWLAIGAVAVGILPIAWRGIIAIRNLTLDINILALIAVIGTICLKDYLEAGTIVFLFTTAEWLESRASHKATAVMSTLMEMTPQKAVIADTGEVVDADEVKVNTILAVKAGEVIPIDGIVVEGKSEVDESTLTGESFPVPKQNDSNVWAGTINLNGYISVRTTALAEDCVVARMAKLVEEAQNSKSKTQRFIDRCAKYYTPGVLCISVGLAVIPAALRVHNENHWFHLALVVLVSACPCALILSTPVATFCALSKAATSGLLIKGGDYLETLSKIKIMAFDKTGTITRGEFVVTDFRSLHSDISFNTLLYWVSSIESKSSHPMATALVDYGRSHSIEPKPEIVEEFQNFPGEGIHGKIDGKDIYVGNRRIAQRSGCQTVPKLEGDAEVGQTIGYIYIGETPAGIFSLSDACRSGVVEAIKELKSLGIKTAMLTGDSNAAAMHAQNQLGNALDLVHAELLPEDKASLIENFKKEGPTAMIGDGINDAPALAIADIGISMGISGSALATETGHVILMTNDMRKIPKAIKLARRCHRKVIENVFLSVTTKVAIIALAIAGHPLIWAAVLADVGTCLLVIFNSMLLLRDTKRHKHGGKSCSTTHVHKHGGRSSCQSSHQTPHVHKHGCSDNGGRSSCHVSHVDKQHSSCSEGKNNKCESKSTNCCSKQSGMVTCVVEVHNVHNNNHLDHSEKNCHGEKNHHIEDDGHKHCHGEKNHHIEEGNHKHCHGEKNHHIEEGNHKHCHGEKNHHIEEGDHKHCHGEKNHHTEEGDHKHCHGEKNHHIEEGDHKHCHGEKNHHIEEGNHKHCHGEKNHHIEEGDHKHCHGDEGDHKHCHGEKNHHHIEEDVHKHCHGEKNHVEGDHHIGESHDMVEEPSCGSKSADLHGCCRSLEKREIGGGGGGCCRKSFRKECCGKNGHFGNGFGPGLSEIVIE